MRYLPTTLRIPSYIYLIRTYNLREVTRARFCPHLFIFGGKIFSKLFSITCFRSVQYTKGGQTSIHVVVFILSTVFGVGMDADTRGVAVAALG